MVVKTQYSTCKDALWKRHQHTIFSVSSFKSNWNITETSSQSLFKSSNLQFSSISTQNVSYYLLSSIHQLFIIFIATIQSITFNDIENHINSHSTSHQTTQTNSLTSFNNNLNFLNNNHFVISFNLILTINHSTDKHRDCFC